jgi:hypothetical protein
MTNPLAKLESIAVEVEQKTALVFGDVVHVSSDVFKVLCDTKAMTPEFRAELTTLIQDFQPIVTALSPIVVSEGTNIAADLAAVAPVLADLKKMVADAMAFLPTLKAAVAQLDADIK